MGNFYVNYTLRGTDPQAVASVLAGRASIVTPAQNGCVVVFDEESDEQNQEIIAELGARLSERLRCPLLAVLNHDDSVLSYQLFCNGELMDEYNSTPGYFGEEIEDIGESSDVSMPQGGDAKLLCETFGVSRVSEVERILRKPSGSDDGYVFAFERHADLVDALGIAGFAIGTSFNAVADDEFSGDLPEDLDPETLIRTQDLVASPGSETEAHRREKPRPGYYKVSFRAVPGLTKSVPAGWMPGFWADLQCDERELSEDFRKATAQFREQFNKLGFTEQGFKKLKRILNPNSRDRGGINYVDSTRSHFGQLLYSKTFIPSRDAEMVSVVVAFTAVFEDEVLSCTNNPNPTFNHIPTSKVLRMKSDDVAAIYRRFVDELKKRTEAPRRFDDLKSLQEWFDSNALEVFEDNVRRGLWVRMSDYEVRVAKRDLPPGS